MIRTYRPNDCGVCALANIFNWRWETAAEEIFGGRWWNKLKFNTKTRQLSDALHEPDARLIRVKDWYDIPDRSIVKVIPSACRKGDWHWVVWRDGLVWDSNHRVPVTPDRYNHRLVSYIGVAE